MYRYKCLNPISAKGLEKLSSDYAVTEEINEADAVLVRSADMHGMELPSGVLTVARAGAGVNNIPLDDFARKGVVVFNTPGANANAVKEMVIAGMLLASRSISSAIEWVRENSDDEDIKKDAEKEKKRFAGTEIEGKKLGVIGLGAIGVRVANAAFHLGMEVYGYDPYISVEAAWNLSHNIIHVKDVNEIYQKCDIITIHVPLLDSTKGMIDSEAISQMKDGVIILNYARDVLVDEKAVVEAIGTGKVRRYMTDFPNTTTAGVKGCVVTPHLGASTDEAEDNCAVMAVKQIMDYIENGNISNSVNFPNCDMGICQAGGRIAVLHKNVANMITKFTTIIGESDANISDLTNKSRGDFAYTLIDLDQAPSGDMIDRLGEIDGVFRVRLIKG